MRAARLLTAAVLAACCNHAFAQGTHFEQAAAAERAGKMREAVLLYAEAARSGDGKAAHRLGEIYEKGVGGQERNPDLALRWYNAARTLGYPPLVGDFPDRKRTKESGRLVP